MLIMEEITLFPVTLFFFVPLGFSLQSIATFGGTSCQIFTTVNGQLLLVVTGSYDSIGKTASRL